MIRTTHLELQSTVRLGKMSGYVVDREKSDNQYADLLKQSNSAFLTKFSAYSEDTRKKSGTVDSVNPMQKGKVSKKYDFTEEIRDKVRDMIPVPRVDLDIADNVYSWLYLRLILQNFGFRVRYRINMFVATVLIVVAALMIACINTVFNSSQSDDPNELSEVIVGPVFVKNMLTITIVYVFLLVLVYFGSLVNSEFMMHRGSISAYIGKEKKKH
jgi:hypothetical protein